MATCLICHAELAKPGRGRPREYCLECRPRHRPLKPAVVAGRKQQQATHGTMYAYNKGCRCGECTSAARERWRTKALKLICAECGDPVSKGKSSLPQGQARCTACRRGAPKPIALVQCTGCYALFPRKGKIKGAVYCTRLCYNTKHPPRRVRAEDDLRVRRQQRERLAPGLGQAARRRLLQKWRTQQRRCTYCPAPALTIDHVLPLVRGGTNHEGNLTPCCKSCNSSKAGWTLIEWRTGKRLPPMTDVLGTRTN